MLKPDFQHPAIGLALLVRRAIGHGRSRADVTLQPKQPSADGVHRCPERLARLRIAGFARALRRRDLLLDAPKSRVRPWCFHIRAGVGISFCAQRLELRVDDRKRLADVLIAAIAFLGGERLARWHVTRLTLDDHLRISRLDAVDLTGIALPDDLGLLRRLRRPVPASGNSEAGRGAGRDCDEYRQGTSRMRDFRHIDLIACGGSDFKIPTALIHEALK